MAEEQLAPIWDKKIENYTLLSDAYNGSGGFIDGSYLVPHPRETLDKLERRKALAYYLNYVKTVVNSLTDPIFQNPAAREWDGQDQEQNLFSQFLLDVDGNKTTIERFMKRAARKAKLNAVAYIVMDNEPEQPATQKEVLEKRAFPYCYILTPSQVRAWETTKSGRIIYFKYEINATKYTSGTKTNTKETWEWWPDRWTVQRADGKQEQGINAIGVVPVVALFAGDEEATNLMPDSDMLQIAKANFALYNICSELREIMRQQAFSILTYPVTSSVDSETAQELVGGTENMLPYDGELAKNKPDFIAPSADPADMLLNEIKMIVTEIYRQAQLNSVTGVQEKTSGVAKAWDFQQTNQSLSDLANNCESAEIKLAFLFSKWTNQDVKYTCKYPDDFGIVDIMAELDKITAALAFMIGGEFDIEVKKKAAQVLLNDLPTDRYDEVIKSIEELGKQAQQANAYNQPPGNQDPNADPNAGGNPAAGG